VKTVSIIVCRNAFPAVVETLLDCGSSSSGSNGSRSGWLSFLEILCSTKHAVIMAILVDFLVRSVVAKQKNFAFSIPNDLSITFLVLEAAVLKLENHALVTIKQKACQATKQLPFLRRRSRIRNDWKQIS
jgi:hypothetical protein